MPDKRSRPKSTTAAMRPMVASGTEVSIAEGWELLAVRTRSDHGRRVRAHLLCS